MQYKLGERHTSDGAQDCDETRRPLRALFVGDSDAIRDLVVVLLERRGFHPTTLAHREAFSLHVDTLAGFDVLVVETGAIPSKVDGTRPFGVPFLERVQDEASILINRVVIVTTSPRMVPRFAQNARIVDAPFEIAEFVEAVEACTAREAKS